MKRIFSATYLRTIIAFSLSLGLILIPAVAAYAAPVKIEHCEGASDVFGAVNWQFYRAQTFTTPFKHTINSVKLEVKTSSHSLGPQEVIVSLKATDVEGKPTGPDLVSATRQALQNIGESKMYQVRHL